MPLCAGTAPRPCPPAGAGAADARVTLLTFGHGTAPRGHLIPLLHAAGVREVVDVRTAPGSRRNPDAGRAALVSWLPEAGIGYRWDRRLGGFRRAAPDSLDVFWENASFRGYAGYSRHPDFLAAMDELLAQACAARTAVMCAEAVWWRCHRRIIADFAVLVRGARVLHLAHDGRLTEHAPTSGARLRDDGLLVYDRV
ncbi:DUF488 domain-containing protein [Microbispora sp. NBRC 16548]|uniref:DUF488 domain-containing protein n=1 Tax=Microbispora sp. NBRC 16548 TaxID=3030994 RepID=UPI0017DE7940|nr:DUF488 domain-containing protein [Microbispora sp. NBRC 16548]GLX09288.1 hypothetical protein Misp03_62140 [Microbispora sp. NBRC 16548]